MPYRLFRTPDAILLEDLEAPGEIRRLSPDFSIDEVFLSESPVEFVAAAFSSAAPAETVDPESALEPPIGTQEVWAAGVTYFRSRTARMEEAESAGGDVFYDIVYEAERPEIFFKATAPRTRGHRARVGIRSDSTWDVPEPELALAITSKGKIFGYTIGNDMSSRSIEGENPLYLPQAKVYTGACSIGPCLFIGDLPGPDSAIRIEIRRNAIVVFEGQTHLSQLKRGFEELAGFLFRSNDFQYGAYLMTGTGIVPDSDFTLQADDEIAISIDGAGTLVNAVEVV
ncbi:MAG: fumarylacetoacetate hydrolase family protein [Verrucomicrobiota bacterium]